MGKETLSTDANSFIKNLTAGRSRFRYLLSFLVSIVLLYLLLRLAKPEDILELFQRTRPLFVLVALGFYLLVVAARALRLHQFRVTRRKPYVAMVPIVSYHSFFNFILPSRSGELTLIYFLRQKLKIDIGSGAGFLLITRLYDLLAMTLFFVGAVFLIDIHGLTASRSWLRAVAGGSLLLLIAIALLLAPLARYAMRLIERILGRETFSGRRLVQMVLKWGHGIEAVFQEVGDFSLSLRLLLTSLFVWVGLFGIFVSLLQGMGFADIPISNIIIGSTAGALTSVLPITAFGNWGTMQIGWAAGFSWAGMDLDSAIASGFAVQIWTMLFSTLVFVLVLIGERIQRHLHPIGLQADET